MLENRTGVTNLMQRGKVKPQYFLKTVRFDNINSGAIFEFCTALLTLLMVTREFMSSKRPVLGIIVILSFLIKLFSPSLLYFIFFDI